MSTVRPLPVPTECQFVGIARQWDPFPTYLVCSPHSTPLTQSSPLYSFVTALARCRSLPFVGFRRACWSSMTDLFTRDWGDSFVPIAVQPTPRLRIPPDSVMATIRGRFAEVNNEAATRPLPTSSMRHRIALFLMRGVHCNPLHAPVLCKTKTRRACTHCQSVHGCCG